MSQTTTQKENKLNLIIFMVSLLIGIAFSEFVLGLVWKGPEPPKAFAHRLSNNPKLLYEPAPNREVAVPIAHTEGKQVWVNKINSDGFRDREFQVKKPADTYRIIFSGDSVVYGYSLDFEDSIPKQLEANLREAAKNRVEVMNFGVSGYDAEQQIEFFKTKGLKYHPDLLVIGYTLNDVRLASFELELFRDQWESFVDIPPATNFGKFVAWSFSHSKILAALNKRLKLQKKVKELRAYPLLADYVEARYKSALDSPSSDYAKLRPQIEAKAARDHLPDSVTRYLLETVGLSYQNPIYGSHWGLTLDAFRKLKNISEKEGIPVVIVIWPLMQEMDRYPLDALHEFLGKNFRDLSFEVVDLRNFCRDLLARYKKEEITSDAIHFNPIGSRAVSKHLAEILAPRLKADVKNS